MAFTTMSTVIAWAKLRLLTQMTIMDYKYRKRQNQSIYAFVKLKQLNKQIFVCWWDIRFYCVIGLRLCHLRSLVCRNLWHNWDSFGMITVLSPLLGTSWMSGFHRQKTIAMPNHTAMTTTHIALPWENIWNAELVSGLTWCYLICFHAENLPD